MHILNFVDEAACNGVAGSMRSIPGETPAFRNGVYGPA